MPGAYCHITLVNRLTNTRRLKSLGLPTDGIKALMVFSKFCDFGAISPDYPYLRATSKSAKEWADVQHHKTKGAIEQNIFEWGVKNLRALKGEEKEKCFAWFCGYASHIVADVTVHPVVNMKVGYYEEGNEAAHRRMEMHQDVLIYEDVYGSKIGDSEHIKNIIGTCTDDNDNDKIDPVVNKFWHKMLEDCYPRIYQEAEPNIHKWHNAVQFLIDDVAEEGGRLFFPSRHLESKGLIYPQRKEVEDQYLFGLATPSGKKNYKRIFEIAVGKAGGVWKMLADGVFLGDQKYVTELGIWDLDSGEKVFNDLVMWG